MDFLNDRVGEPVVEEGPWYDSDAGALSRVKEARQDFQRSGASAWLEEATECMNFVAGRQWTDEEEAAFEQGNRAPAVLNWIQRIVNAISGQQVANRQEPRYLGREEADFKKSDVATAIARWVRGLADEEDEDSQAFRDLIITGMGWTVRRMEYDRDPAGMIVKERLDPRRMRWDATSRRKNLADARWVQCDYWFSREEIAEQWGEEIADQITVAPNNAQIDKSEPHDAQNDWRYIKNQSHLDQRNGDYRVVHHIEWCRHPEYQIDVEGEIVPMDEETFELARERADELGEPLPKYARRLKRVYYEVWSVGETVLQRGLAEIQSDFSYQCVSGLRDDERGLWFGLVKPLLDPQRLSNKLFIATMHAIATNAKGGLIVERDAVENVRKFEESWARSDAVSWVKPGANSGGKIAPKQPPLLPPEMGKLMEFMVQSIPQIAGANPEMLGQGTEAGQPGVVESMRTKAGLIVLAPWFDAMRLYTKRDGRVLAEYISKFISDGRKARIVGDEGMMDVVLDDSLDWLRYDVIVDESTQSRDVKDRTFMALMQIVPAMMQMGLPPPPDALQYAPLPQSLVQKWQQAISEAQKQPPAPPPQVLVEQERQKGQLQLEQMKQSGKQGEVQGKLQAQAATEAMQSETEERIARAQMALQDRKLQGEMQMAQFQAVIDARLTAFEAILKGMLSAMTSSQKLAMEQEREQTIAETQGGNGHQSSE
jgi:hypothetical protein